MRVYVCRVPIVSPSFRRLPKSPPISIYSSTAHIFRGRMRANSSFFALTGTPAVARTGTRSLSRRRKNGQSNRNYYLYVPLDHPDSYRWRAEIAKYPAPLVLSSTYNSLPTTMCVFYIPLRASLTALFPNTLPSLRPKCTAATSCNAVNTVLHNTHDYLLR